MTSALLSSGWTAVPTAGVGAITLKPCWDGLEEDLLVVVSAHGL